jgi:hypothetical protein
MGAGRIGLEGEPVITGFQADRQFLVQGIRIVREAEK